MKIETRSTEPKFEPITIIITVNSLDELRTVAAMTTHSVQSTGKELTYLKRKNIISSLPSALVVKQVLGQLHGRVITLLRKYDK